MRLETAPDLDWSAFLYVAGELPPAEATAFEVLLADDQGAREAVARAVGLVGAVARAGDGMVIAMPPRRSPIRRLVTGSGVAAAAAVVLFALARPASDLPRETRVARAWSGLRADHDGEWSSAVPEGIREVSVPVETEAVADIEADAASERGVPSWMLAAAGPKADESPREGN